MWLAAGAAGAEEKPAPLPPPPSLDNFYEDPLFSHAQLSPDGRYLAVVQGGDVSAVLVTDLQGHTTQPILSLMQKGKTVKGLTADWIRWKSNDRLIVGLTLFDIRRAGDKPDGEIIGWRFGRFMMAMDRDGKNQLQLLKGGFWNSDRGGNVTLLDRLHNDPDHVLAIAPKTSGDPAVWKVNIKTGDAQMVESGDDNTDSWDTDAAGNIVTRMRDSGNSVIIEARAPGETKWTQVVKLRPKDKKELADFDILGPTDKPSQLYVAVKPKDKSEGETRRLRIYDLSTKTLSAPVWPELKYDVENIVQDDETYALKAVCYTVDVYTCDFKDPTMQAYFKGLSKFFKNDRSITPVSISSDGRWWLLLVSGPDEPATYYMFDWNEKNIDEVAPEYNHLSTAALAEKLRWSYPARDGTAIPAYLTRPRFAPKTPLPLIVMPHGGPEARDAFDYDTWSQYLSTRGYLVFQPNFRGSRGFGITWAEAGYGQWSGRMADDVTDGVKALISSGQADPNRICVFGASYGGYAALWAGATHPELYKCVVSWAGDADLMLSMKFEKSFGGKEGTRYQYWLKSIGDPEKQADALKKASPISYAETYKPPVLLIHGADDQTVTPEQSRNMEHALKKAGKDVKLIVYKDEDHTDWDTAHEKDAIDQVAKFIQAHIAPIPTTQAATAPAAAAQAAAAK
ncbi:alpha/beta hydrolase family protein [Phenylobacterium montanum]|uniref:S9 family peptidase n=1 Tax=Phenylobacterium montanum TaxID=2823693 RepID=A0A975IXY2_9CAUL|nr:S9 family peptidase [Caulobacter sp. S6]QUD89896.1 S9 family peptidase [Caulobacter sp. S6]